MTFAIATNRDTKIRELVAAVFSDQNAIQQEDVALRVIHLMDKPVEEFDVDALQRGFQSARTIVRFGGMSMKILDMVGPHQDRVAFMPNFSQHLLYASFPDLDFVKLGFEGRNHDAGEGISPLWDIPTNKKAALTDDQKWLLHEIERKISVLLARLNYTQYYNEPDKLREIFMEMQEKTSLESWIVKWFDIIDAFMVVLREMEAGNPEFVDVYERHLATMQGIRDGTKYPEIGKFLWKLRFRKTRKQLRRSFWEDRWLCSHFLSSFHLFDIESLSNDCRQPDDSLIFPQWYRVWKEKIDQWDKSLKD